MGFFSRSIRYGARLSDKPTISTPLVRRCPKFPVIRRAHGLALLAVPVANERVVVKFVCQNIGPPLFHVGVVTRTAVILLAGVLMRLHCAPVLNGPCALYRDNRAVSHDYPASLRSPIPDSFESIERRFCLHGTLKGIYSSASLSMTYGAVPHASLE